MMVDCPHFKKKSNINSPLLIYIVQRLMSIERGYLTPPIMAANLKGLENLPKIVLSTYGLNDTCITVER